MRDRYLAPDAADIGASVRGIYADKAALYGAPLDIEAIVKAKSDWFRQWSSWTLALKPGSLAVTPVGGGRVNAVFDMAYDYVPKTGARAKGEARVMLGLVEAASGGWRIEWETSQALP